MSSDKSNNSWVNTRSGGYNVVYTVLDQTNMHTFGYSTVGIDGQTEKVQKFNTLLKAETRCIGNITNNFFHSSSNVGLYEHETLTSLKKAWNELTVFFVQ